MTTPVVADPSAAPADPNATLPVTPPAAPAAPATIPDIGADPVPQSDPDPVTDTVDEVIYEATGDVGLDVALAFIGKLGIDGNHAAMVAAGKGDFSLLKATLATMGDKARGWEAMVELGQQSFTRNAEAAEAKATAIVGAIHAEAGGAENWALVQAWAKANADPAERVEINVMLNGGPVSAKAATRMLVEAYAQASGTTVSPASAVRPGAAATPAASTGPLNRPEYFAQVQALRLRLGNAMESSPEYAALGRRLQA